MEKDHSRRKISESVYTVEVECKDLFTSLLSRSCWDLTGS